MLLVIEPFPLGFEYTYTAELIIELNAVVDPK